MRVISGNARGKKLYTTSGLDIRPTLDRVKESIFNMLAFHLSDACVLDLFCGSGALGVEALSRGADHAVFVDNHRESLACTEKNLQMTHLDKKATLVLSDGIEFLKTVNRKFDIIFLDPPYESILYEQALENISIGRLLNVGGRVIVECDKVKTPAFSVNGFFIDREKTYGRVKILIMKE